MQPAHELVVELVVCCQQRGRSRHTTHDNEGAVLTQVHFHQVKRRELRRQTTNQVDISPRDQWVPFRLQNELLSCRRRRDASIRRIVPVVARRLNRAIEAGPDPNMLVEKQRELLHGAEKLAFTMRARSRHCTAPFSVQYTHA